MAFSSNNVTNTILAIFLSCLIMNLMNINSAKSFFAKADLVDDVCSQTVIDPNYCKTALRSDPRTSKANLPTLAQVAIDLARSNTKSTITLVKSIEKKVTDRRLKGIYDTCLENYSDTSDNLDGCVTALKAKDYPTLNIRASAALDGPSTCDEGFTEAKLSEPGQLKTSSRHVQELSSVICNIANRLSAGRI
ncbi:OLC1v1013262C1 [Oldenlandia corymbosa var. corymbosa]|uniref:OLC1v1013262C1 n=1 Tax=Oldenlandia corymbosa var. corymbosa TaxID=529605 RepID=A0AAV1DY14_OLDCO|nr:OLC1v1013262C1 [Oldenlandia corymbosa var. corymbosa]